MLRILSILICLLICQSIFSQDAFLEAKIEKWKGQHKYMIECLELLEEKDLDFRPTVDEMNTRDLLLHMGSNILWITQDYLQGTGYKPLFNRKDLTKSELIKHMNSLFEFSTQTLKEYAPHLLKTRVDFFAGEKNMMQMVELLDDHLTHHKGQLTVYMRLCDKKAPKFVGW